MISFNVEVGQVYEMRSGLVVEVICKLPRKLANGTLFLAMEGVDSPDCVYPLTEFGLAPGRFDGFHPHSLFKKLTKSEVRLWRQRLKVELKSK